MPFSTPDAFLDYLKAQYSSPPRHGTLDAELLMLTQADFNVLYPQDDFPSGRLEGLTFVASELKTDAFGSLIAEAATRVSSSVTLGVLDTGEANAAIYKSDDGKFAILLNSGLMLLLNKFFKLIVAWDDPRLVTYCNRKPAAELSLEELRGYLLELVERYRHFGAPYGAILKLDLSVAARQSSLVYLSELFIVCHELGHFLNGDLEDESMFCAVEGNPGLRRFEENRNHAAEYAADATGFRILQRVLEGKTGFSSISGLQAVICLFNLFFLLSQEQSVTHPNPRTRSVRLARDFYGEDFASLLEKSFDQPELLPELFGDVPPSLQITPA